MCRTKKMFRTQQKEFVTDTLARKISPLALLGRNDRDGFYFQRPIRLRRSNDVAPAPLRVTWRGSEACDILPPPVILRSAATKDLFLNGKCKMSNVKFWTALKQYSRKQNHVFAPAPPICRKALAGKVKAARVFIPNNSQKEAKRRFSFYIQFLRVRKPRLSVSAPNLPHTCGSCRKGEGCARFIISVP